MSDLQLDDVKTDENAAMVLLVDDQAMIGEAVRRGLALEQNIDFHFCADPHQAIAQADRWLYAAKADGRDCVRGEPVARCGEPAVPELLK